MTTFVQYDIFGNAREIEPRFYLYIVSVVKDEKLVLRHGTRSEHQPNLVNWKPGAKPLTYQRRSTAENRAAVLSDRIGLKVRVGETYG